MTDEEQIRITAALHIAVGDLQNQVDDLQMKVQTIGTIAESMISVLKAFSDLYLELTDRTAERKFLEKSILKAEREVARTKLPIWFWRYDLQQEPKAQIINRVKYLRDNQYSIDDLWTLIREFCDEYAPEKISNKTLESIIEHSMMQEDLP